MSRGEERRGEERRGKKRRGRDVEREREGEKNWIESKEERSAEE